MQRKVANQFVENSANYTLTPVPGTTYKIYGEEKTIAGATQRWVLVYSEEAHKRAQKTLSRALQKEREVIKKILNKLGKQVFNCQADAQKALKKEAKKWKFHQVDTNKFQPVQKHNRKGRPSKDAIKSTIGYHMQTTIKEYPEKISLFLKKKSHFILATNQLNHNLLSNEEVLSEYKNQQKVARGFAFIKDNTFEVSSVFLKKPSRISALMAIMVFSLFIYSLTQYFLRQSLKENGDFVLNQLKKPIQNPTAKWIFFLFRNIQVLYIQATNTLTQELVVNLTPELNRIISYFGEETMDIYGITMSDKNKNG